MTAQLSEYATSGAAMMAGDENGGGGGGSSSNDSGGCVVVGADADGSAERVVLISFKMEDEECVADVDAGLQEDGVDLEQLVVQTQSPPPSFSDEGDQGTSLEFFSYS